jgi:CheY-like chemotaxis protein
MLAEPVRTVLVVEDDPPVRVLLERLVRGAGYEVLSAGTGAEALAVLGARGGADTSGVEIDLLLTDIGLADLHGGELARRALELRPGLPVVYASGQGIAGAIRRGMPAGDGFLLKPFRGEELAQVLGAVFAARG